MVRDTFIVMALLILIISPVVILRTPTDIFPNIDIPVISVAWQYAGLNAEEVEGRITSPFERSLSTLVDNIQHLESTSYNGEAVIKIFLPPRFGERGGRQAGVDPSSSSQAPCPQLGRSQA